ncbi:hypothetical protein AB0L70_34700 [Kribbella sp. NPDC051952]|uniref:hypothetical protein n=1 Tax=Kribbella sp. NPDC051952 TaxID=3154851 RepID=UPI003430DB6A
MELDRAVVELYGLEPERFIAARNRLVEVLRGQGDERSAAAVLGLRKPTVAAWLANQLVRADPEGIQTLTELGEQLRESYLSADSARRRELTRQRHDLVDNLVMIARSQATSGRRVSAQTVDRLAETLDAALVDPGAIQLLRTGQLTSALRHVGFGVVDENGDPAKLAPVQPRVVRRTQPRHKVTPSRDNAQQKRAGQAEDDYTEAEAQRTTAEQLLDAHEHRVEDLEADLARLNEQVEETRQTLRTARKQTPRLQQALNRATRHAAATKKRRDLELQRLTALDV